jgi:hypothetical protein
MKYNKFVLGNVSRIIIMITKGNYIKGVKE